VTGFLWLWTSFRSCAIRIEPNTNTRRPPRAAATRRASAKGIVPDKVTKVILALPRFWKMKMRSADKIISDGNILIQALLARVDLIVLAEIEVIESVGGD
jgi:hypothetical protein